MSGVQRDHSRSVVMKSITAAWVGSRRRFLGWLGVLGVGVPLKWLPRRGESGGRSMKEAEFYRRTDEDR